MEEQLKNDRLDIASRPAGAGADSTSDTMWDWIRVLWNRRLLVASITTLAAIVSVVIALVLPVWFKASTRLLLPESGSGSISGALLGDLPSAARSFLGGTTGNYTRYLAILESRSIHERLVVRHDLTTVYGVSESSTAVEDAIEILRGNTEFAVDEELEFLSISVFDKDPQLAAVLANDFVSELNLTNARLSSLTAANFRKYVELRYNEAMSSRDSVQQAVSIFQEEYGLFDLEIQSQAYFDQIAIVRATNLEAEIQYEALRTRLGPNNPQVLGFKEIVSASERKFDDMLAGSEVVLPISQDSIPTVIRQYADLQLQLLIEEKTLEVVGPLLEQARFDEQKSFEAVQVVDTAVPPVRKAKPRRAVLCVTITLSAFLLSVLFAFTLEWWRRNGTRIQRELSGLNS